jgi:hypothetical protein
MVSCTYPIATLPLYTCDYGEQGMTETENSLKGGATESLTTLYLWFRMVPRRL